MFNVNTGYTWGPDPDRGQQVTHTHTHTHTHARTHAHARARLAAHGSVNIVYAIFVETGL